MTSRCCGPVRHDPRWAGTVCGELAEPSNGFIPRREVSLRVEWMGRTCVPCLSHFRYPNVSTGQCGFASRFDVDNYCTRS